MCGLTSLNSEKIISKSSIFQKTRALEFDTIKLQQMMFQKTKYPIKKDVFDIGSPKRPDIDY
jgi:hypothetical protein